MSFSKYHNCLTNLVNVTCSLNEELAEEFVRIRHVEIFLTKDDKFYLNEWMDTFIWLSNQDSSRKKKWGHYNLNNYHN